MFGENSTLCDTDEVCRSMSCARTAGLNYRYSRFDCADDLFGDMCQAANRFMMQVINEQDGSQIHYEPTETDYLTGVETRRP